MKLDFATLKKRFFSILVKSGFNPAEARPIAATFAETTFDGVFSHGINRFPRFIGDVVAGTVVPGAVPVKCTGTGAVEQWDGNRGAGITNALHCTDRSMELASGSGIGCVALRNTNHWMRGGSYGWRAAEKGYLFMAWTNTLPNMPPWGGCVPTLGNNPLVMALPREEGPVVLDMAMSQFSYGKLEWHRRKGEQLPEFGGFDREGHLTKDPEQILGTERILPIGLWKGSALSLVLDLAAAMLSGGNTTREIGNLTTETSLSQLFISVDLDQFCGKEEREKVMRETLDYILSRNPEARFPGQQSLLRRAYHTEHGVEVPDALWEEILKL